MASKRGTSPHTSIYINRMYEERKTNLGKREHSGSKPAANIDPYQWRMKDKDREKGECEYM